MKSLPANDFKLLFATLPGLYLILKPDFIIVAVSNSYLNATMTEREVILGRGIFDVFPDNPDDIDADGVLNLRASLNAVKQFGQPHRMAVQKYDIRKPDGAFEERYWSQLNSPVFNEQNELLYLIHNVVDVTSSQQVEAKLRKSEKDYQLLVNSVKDYAIFMVNSNGLVTSWNSGAESIKGYPEAEIIGKSIDIFYTEEDLKQRVPQYNLQMALKYGHFETEGLRLRKDGTCFWANNVFTALKDEAGIFYGYSEITRDITERKNTQKQLEILSRQINQSSDGIYTTDANRKIKSWNIGAQNLYGFTKEEVLEKDSNEILRTVITEEDTIIILNEIAEKDYWTGELHRRTKTDKDVYVRSSSTAIRDSKGVITGYVGVSVDITEQKILRERVNHLANIVEQSSEAIISRGIDQRFISWNSGAERLFGYSKEEAIGKTPLDLQFTMLTEQEIADIGQQVIEKGSWTSEREFFHKNGSSFFGTVSANAVRNEQGEFTSMVFIMKDISLLKQLEDQLKKYNVELEQQVKARTEEIINSEKRFRALVENNYDIISLIDESFKIIYRSPSVTRVMGFDTGEMKKMEGIENVHPDDREYAANLIKEAIANPGKPLSAMFRRQHKNGHYIWLEGIVTNLLHDEQVKAIITNFRDITERIEAEEKLKASEKQFRSTLDNMLEGVQIIGFDWRYIYVNDAMARHGKYLKKELLGYTVTEKYPGIEHTEIFKVYQRCFNERVPIELEYEFEFPDKSKGWFELSFQPVPEGIFILSIDITEKKIAEKQKEFDTNNLNALINNTSDLIWSVDRDFKLITSNKAFDKLLISFTGKLPEKGSTILLEAFSKTHLKRHKQYYERAFSGVSFTETEHHGTAKDFWFEISFYPIYEGNLVIGTACFSRNITEKKKAEQVRLKAKVEEQKKITKAMLIGQERERNYIGQELHDNVNQILVGTKIFLSIAGNKNKEVKELIKYPMELIDSSIEEIRILCRKIVTPLKNIDLKELIGDLIYKLDQTEKIKSEFIYSVTDGILSDDLQLNIYRIIQELVNNIVKYAEAKIVNITVKANDKGIDIIVTDDGRGFDHAKKRKGIGISNMINRVESFNGKIEIKSSAGNGCRTTITIPN